MKIINSKIVNHVLDLDLGFDSPVMVATDYTCSECKQAVYVTPNEEKANPTITLDPFCSCGKPTMDTLQVDRMYFEMCEGTLKLEEVF